MRSAPRFASLAAAVAAALTLGACGGATADDAALLAYDTSAPLDVVDRGVLDEGSPIAVHDVSFTSGDDRVEGYLAVPPGAGRRPAVLYLHAAGSDRSQLLEAALWLAARGAVTMTITAPSTTDAPQELPPEAALARFGERAVADLVAARRALDLLQARPDVDGERLAVVGWSAGGRAAATVSGVDGRVRAAVLLAPGAVPVSEYVAAAPPELQDAVEETMRRIDPFSALAGTTADVLVQAGRRDDVVPSTAIEALVAAAPEGSTELRWYDAGHALDDTAYREHLDWLSERLPVDGPVVVGAATGP